MRLALCLAVALTLAACGQSAVAPPPAHIAAPAEAKAAATAITATPNRWPVSLRASNTSPNCVTAKPRRERVPYTQIILKYNADDSARFRGGSIRAGHIQALAGGEGRADEPAEH